MHVCLFRPSAYSLVSTCSTSTDKSANKACSAEYYPSCHTQHQITSLSVVPLFNILLIWKASVTVSCQAVATATQRLLEAEVNRLQHSTCCLLQSDESLCQHKRYSDYKFVQHKPLLSTSSSTLHRPGCSQAACRAGGSRNRGCQ